MYVLFASAAFFGVRRMSTPAPPPEPAVSLRPELRPWDYLGCYDLEVEPWSYERVVRQGELSVRESAAPPAGASTRLTPDRIRLAADSVDEWGRELDTYRAMALDADREEVREDRLRWFVRADTLWLVWSDGPVRGGVALFASADSLMGSARSFSRRDSLDATARATAWRINCATYAREGSRTGPHR